MSLAQALEDGIPVERNEKIGSTAFYPPCCICGASVKSPEYVRDARYVCHECRRMLIEAKASPKGLEIEKKEKKLRTALSRIRKHHRIEDYDEAVRKVQKGFSKPYYYASVEEIMAALELIRNDFVIYHQVDVAGYRVDFIIPALGAILEVDGELYHRGGVNENIRDEVLKIKTGYEVVHIPTRYINADITKLVPAIRAVVKKRQSQMKGV